VTVTIAGTSAAAGPADPFVMTDAEKAVLAIPGLTGWWEADHFVKAANGFRWGSRLGLEAAIPYTAQPPILVTGSHGRPALRTGYGGPKFETTNRGTMQTPSRLALLSEAGWTVINVYMVPTVASGVSSIVGGYLWSSMGPSTTTTPRLIISSTTGKTVLNGGGAAISNSTPAPVDLRDGLWHVTVSTYDALNHRLKVATDRTRLVGSSAAANTAIPASANAPLLLGQFKSTAPQPFYGERSAELTFSRELTTQEIAVAIDSYLALKYGVTLV
jgi:hypothetical protein